MASRAGMRSNDSVNLDEPLSVPSGFKPPHPPFPLAGWFTKDVGSIILTNRIAATSGFKGVSVYSATKAVVALDRQQRTLEDAVFGPLRAKLEIFPSRARGELVISDSLPNRPTSVFLSRLARLLELVALGSNHSHQIIPRLHK